MKNIKVVLYNTKKYDAENIDDVQILENENNATTIEVQFPSEYIDYSKRVEFQNVKGEKWTTSLYAPEDNRNVYDANFDKLNFRFTIPSAMTKRGELKVQLIAYLADGTNTIVPFQVILLKIDNSILYATKEGKENPDLVIKAYEYANLSLEIANEANERSKHAEELTIDAAESAENAEISAKNAENSAKASQNSAKSAENSAKEAQNSASQAQASASASQQSASQAEASAQRAEELSGVANENSEYAVETSDNANTKSTKALEIVANLSVSSEEIDCEEHVSVEIQTNTTTEHKNIHFSVPAPKKGTSYRNKGAWHNDETYINDQYFIDTVSIFGCTYYCKQTNTGHQPLDSAESGYWGLIALRGTDAGVTIVDNLNSENSGYVLSAKQGKVLKELIASSIQTAITNLINNSPENLNTLKELADAINNDPAFHTTITNLITTNSTNITKIINGTTTVKRAEEAQKLMSTDNRDTNTLPSGYMSNNPKQIITEFKTTSTIGVNSLLTASTYCQLITIIPWTDSSGGYPVQIAFNGSGVAYRVGTADATWGSWNKLSTVAELTTRCDNLQTQINNMLNGTTTFTLLKANVVDLV